MKIAVTGATGHLGSLVVKILSEKIDKEDIVALVHNESHAKDLIKEGYEIREIDFQNVSTLNTALQNVDTLIYVASKTYSVFDRVRELENVLSAMKENHVANLVAMSFIADQEDNPFVMSPFYGYLPRRLAGTKLNYAIAKNSLYADPLVPYLPELGKIMTKVTSHEIGYHPVSVEEFGKIYAAEGDGEELASMYAGGAMGYLHGLSDDFAHITEHEPESMEHFLARNYHQNN